MLLDIKIHTCSRVTSETTYAQKGAQLLIVGTPGAIPGFSPGVATRRYRGAARIPVCDSGRESWDSGLRERSASRPGAVFCFQGFFGVRKDLLTLKKF